MRLTGGFVGGLRTPLAAKDAMITPRNLLLGVSAAKECRWLNRTRCKDSRFWQRRRPVADFVAVSDVNQSVLQVTSTLEERTEDVAMAVNECSRMKDAV